MLLKNGLGERNRQIILHVEQPKEAEHFSLLPSQVKTRGETSKKNIIEAARETNKAEYKTLARFFLLLSV